LPGLVAAPVESIEGYLLGIPLRVANDIFFEELRVTKVVLDFVNPKGVQISSLPVGR